MINSDKPSQIVGAGAASWNDAAKSHRLPKISGSGSMTEAQIVQELQDGGKLVMYYWTISVLIMTFRRASAIHLIKSGDSRLVPGLGFSALTFIVGWWGLPWGPIYTIQSLFKNFSGGIDITQDSLVSADGKMRLALASA